MRTIAFILAGLFIFQFNLKSQDLIRLKNGDSLICKITKIDSVKIYLDVEKMNKSFSTFINKNEVVSYDYNYNFPKKPNNKGLRTSKDDIFQFSFDPLGFVTMGPSITGEFLIQGNDRNFGFGISTGIRVTNLGLASNLLMGGGGMKLSFTVPFAIKFYPKTRNIADGLFVGPHVEYGASNFKDGFKNRIRAFGLEFGYKWVFQSGFTLELVDLVGLIQHKNLPYSYTTTTPHSTTTVTYEETDWMNLAFVPYVFGLRLGKTF
jgi:hypothetical protein